jgi:hypothetical protein
LNLPVSDAMAFRFSGQYVNRDGYYSDGSIPGRSALGGPNRLRGYPYLSLAGSRVWLVNQEWRFPILNAIDLAFPFGRLRLPGIQGAAFDAGSSWLGRPQGVGQLRLGFPASREPNNAAPRMWAGLCGTEVRPWCSGR